VHVLVRRVRSARGVLLVDQARSITCALVGVGPYEVTLLGGVQARWVEAKAICHAEASTFMNKVDREDDTTPTASATGGSR
jgi:hypothetical protein